MDKIEFKTLLSDDKKAIRIIRDVAYLEWLLDIVLLGYFSNPSKINEFRELFLSRLFFSKKIDFLKKLNNERTTQKKLNSVADQLNKFRKVRNILAHNRIIRDKDIINLNNNNEIRKIFENYPTNYNNAIKELEKSLKGFTHIKTIKPFKLDDLSNVI